MNNLIRIKQIVDHITKEPFYPTTHAIGVGYTNKNGECITVQEAIDNLNSTFEALSEFDLTLGHNEGQAFPGNEGAELQDLLNSLTVDDELSLTSKNPVQNSVVTQNINQLFDALEDKADKNNVYTKDEVYTKEESDDKYATKTEVNNGLNTKQDTLVSGVNIKTINNDSILGSGNLALSNSDDIVKEIVYDDDYVEQKYYKALKQGEEQMLVLKSMGNALDIVPIPDDYKKFDLNNDNTINYTEVEMIYDFMYGPILHIWEERDPITGDVTYSYWNSGLSVIEEEVNGVFQDVWYVVRREKNNDLTLWKSLDYGHVWIKQDTKDPDISPTSTLNPQLIVNGHVINVEPDDEITTNDSTNLHTIIFYFLAQHNINYVENEFEGENTLFAVFDPNKNKIVIGYNFEDYTKAPKESNEEDVMIKSDFILAEFDPSPNVIYCNSFNNKLYRWQKETSFTGRMIEVNVQIALNSIVSSIQNNITSIQNHIEALETYVEDQGGIIYHDEPGEPLDPGRL